VPSPAPHPSLEPFKAELLQLRRLELASAVEATTLLLLVGVAVPLKHLAGWPLGVKTLGPLHGLAFVTYLWVALQTLSDGQWRAGDRIRLFVAAIVPFGGFVNLGFLRRRVSALKMLQATL